jgi:hypothetical protein
MLLVRAQNECMSVVEDLRQVLQDFLAPELRAVAAKFDAVDSKFALLNSRIDSLESKMNTRFDAMDSKFSAMDSKFGALEATVSARLSAAEDKASSRQEILLIQFEAVKGLMDMDRRVQRLESQRIDSGVKSA